MALLCTWLLVQPRWLRADLRQRVTVILIDGLDDGCFATSPAELPAVLDAISRGAAHTDGIVFTADRPGERPLSRRRCRRGASNAYTLATGSARHRSRAGLLGGTARRSRRAGLVCHRPPTRDAAGRGHAAGLWRVHPELWLRRSSHWREPNWACDSRRWCAILALLHSSGSGGSNNRSTVRRQPQKLTLAPGEIATVPGSFPPVRQITVHLLPYPSRSTHSRRLSSRPSKATADSPRK